MNFEVLIKRLIIFIMIITITTLCVSKSNFEKVIYSSKHHNSKTLEVNDSFYESSNKFTELALLTSNENVQYYDPSSKELKTQEAISIEEDVTELRSGWYVLDSSIVLNGRLKITGDVNIILADSYTLNAPKGIEVIEGNNLTIWGQSADYENNGQIIARGPGDSAGIGGNKGQNSGVITINGGNIQATGGDNDGAGIGGGDHGKGTVFINGGYVYANGGMLGSGIGGGLAGNGEVTITGGIIEAYGGYASATGIGGGCDGSGDVIITGGNIYAEGGDLATGIGGGQNGYGNVQITGGEVWAVGGSRNDYDIGDGTNDNHTTLPKEGTFSTGDNGKAIVHGSICDESEKENWKGIVDDTVYGDFVLDHDVTFDGTLTVPDGSSLTVKKGATLTTSEGIENHGKIENEGTIENNTEFVNDGELFNDGIIDNYGNLENTSNGVVENNNDFNNSGYLSNEGNFVNDGNLYNGGFLNNENNFTNNGLVENDNTIVNSGNLTNDGNINNDGRLTNDGEVSNNGTLNNTSDGVIKNNDSFTNSGKLTNDGDVTNSGEFNNTSEGVITNNETFTNDGNVTNDGKVNNTGNFNNTNEGSITNNETFTNSGNVSNNGKITNEGEIKNTNGSNFENKENGLIENNKDFVNDSGSNYKNDGTTQNKTYSVIFISFNNQQLLKLDVEYGNKLIFLNYNRKGYTLEGWYLDKDLKEKWNFNNDTMPSHDITLYAKWKANSYKVSFTSDEDIELPSDFIKDYGTTIKFPELPKKTGYTGKWVVDGKEVTEITIMGNVTVKAIYTANSYTVKYMSGNNIVSKKAVHYGEKAPQLYLNNTNSYLFEGWYTDEYFSNKWNFDQDTVLENITLYAKWIKLDGVISEDVKLSDDDLGVKLDMSKGDLADAVLNDEDRKLLEEGKNIQVILDVNKASISSKDEEVINEKNKNYNIFKYFDISVLKVIGNNKEPIYETQKPIRITIDIPVELRNIKNREYIVIRLHNGIVTELKDLDNDEATYTFESDKFSIYALAYKDKIIEEKKDNHIFQIIGLIITIVLIISVILINVKRKKDNY